MCQERCIKMADRLNQALVNADNQRNGASRYSGNDVGGAHQDASGDNQQIAQQIMAVFNVHSVCAAPVKNFVDAPGQQEYTLPAPPHECRPHDAQLTHSPYFTCGQPALTRQRPPRLILCRLMTNRMKYAGEATGHSVFSRQLSLAREYP